MKNDRGITLTILAVIIIVMFILVGTTSSQFLGALKESTSKNEFIELGIIRQAITEQYFKASAVNELNKSVNEERVRFWKGNIVQNLSEKLPEQSSLTIKEKDTEAITNFYDTAENYDTSNCSYQEELYYELSPNDLKDLGVNDAKSNYIVNYKTKEIYDTTKKISAENELLYLSEN